MNNVAKYYLALMCLWGGLLLTMYFIYGADGYLQLSKQYIDMIGQDSELYYGGLTVSEVGGDEYLRPMLPGLNSNTTAYLFLLAIPLAYYHWVQQPRRLVYLFLFVFFCVLAVFTLSRQGIVFTALFLLYAVLSDKSVYRRVIILATICVAAVTVFSFFPVVIHRFLQPIYMFLGYEYDYVINTSERFGSIESSLDIILSNPFGIGYSAYNDMIGNTMAAEHNLALAVSINNGLLVGVLLVVAISHTILRYYRSVICIRHNAVGMAFFVLNYMMLASIMFAPNASLFWIYYGVSNAYLNSQECGRPFLKRPVFGTYSEPKK